MNVMQRRYCLDANVLIQAWRTYYSPRLCADYWHVLDELGNQHRIFIIQEVVDEIDRIEDGLKAWMRGSRVPVRTADGAVVASTNIHFAYEEYRKPIDGENDQVIKRHRAIP